ncbi:MAG: SIS domain-containing protein [Armatimonadota bacterium]|nr:SIS domain-containing protein [Armatimonadota bacterium]
MAASSERYYCIVNDLLARIASTQHERIQQAAKVIADHIADGGILYLLGSGHSLAVAMEAFHRAGGLAPVDVIYDRTFGRAERLEGYAETLLKDYNIPAGGVVIIISNSGRNALPIEVALHCKARGITTIAITSLAHSQAVSSRHSSGKRLFEIADIVIDNCGVFGDAALDVEGVPAKVCPTSGIAGMFIIESIVAQVIENLVKAGHEPPVFISANVDGGDEHNARLYEKYWHRIRGL